MSIPRESKLLPLEARAILQRAYSSTGNPLERRIAVDRAIERVKREYPSYFRTESGDDDSGRGK